MDATVLRQFARFIFVGLISLICDLSIFCFLIWSVGINSVAAASMAYAVSVSLNYLLHAVFTFRTEVGLGSGIKFGALLVWHYIVTVAFVYGFEAAIGSPFTGKVVSLIPVTLGGYFLGRTYVFRERGKSPDAKRSRSGISGTSI